MNEPDLPAAVYDAIAEWLDRREPLCRAEFDKINSALVREVGDAATHSEYGRNKHLRKTTATEVGQFAVEQDIALAELDDAVEYVDLHGYAVEDGYVPVLVCLSGELESVADRQHQLYHQIDDTSPCECRAATDGGRPGSDDVPPARQCTMPSCEREAVDPANRASPCPKHHPDIDAGSESANQQNTPEDGGSLVSDSTVSGETTDESPEEPAFPEVTSTPATEESGVWDSAEFTNPDSGVFPSPWDSREQWMCHTPGDKKPYAPWGDRDHPSADEDDDARWQWGLVENYTDLETAREWADMVPTLAGVTYLLREEDEEPHAFVDGDDVRCPETGDVHPEFTRVLAQLGPTYADVSVSGSGVHAPYIGNLPDGVKQVKFAIDDEPWGENDDLPEIEIYDHKRVCVSTGEHVPGTPTELREWDANALETILDEYDQLSEPSTSTADAYEAFDASEYDAAATASDETTTDIRDVFAALDRLDARRVAEQTIVHSWNDSASTSGDKRAFAPTWGPSANGTANVVDREIWQDTGGGGYGGPVVMALIDAGEVRPNNATPRVSGETWWRGIERLRELGFDIPEYETTAGPDGASGGAPSPAECAPPAVEFASFDAQRRWDALQDERYDEYLQSTGPSIWGDHAGAGKTTNAGRAAAQRDRPFVLLFDKHEKAREFATDSATPAIDMHLKGAEQKRHEACMDADHADESCPDHGENGCPHMCPIYDLDPDDEDRKRYEAVVEEVGPVQAHMILDLPYHDDDGCLWIQQFDEVESADRIVGVHEYQTLKTVRHGRDVIVDESPSSLMSERQVSIEGMARAANTLNSLADIPRMPDGLASFSRVARDIIDAVTGEETPDELASLSPPAIEGESFYEEVDPDDLPADVEPEDVELRNIKEDVGMPGEGYVTREKHVVERTNIAEEFAQLKLAYNESIVNRMRRGEWNGAPLCFDALLAAAAEAGADTKAARQAIAIPTLLEHCPWCGSDIAEHNGARVCADEDCDWHEEHHPVTSQKTEQARALSWLGLGDEDPAGLHYADLPLASSLPRNPLVLDATATPSKVAGLYDVPEGSVDVDGDEHLETNLHTTQVVDGQYHRGTLKESQSARDRIQQTIETVGQVHDKPLFVGPKKLLSFFEFPSHGEQLHYHGARGLNRADCDAVVCIGAPHPRMDDLQREATLFAQGSTDVRVGGEEHSTRRDAPNPEVWRKLLYQDDAGMGRAVATKHFTGLVGDLFRETREKELVQAVHRIRPLLADDEKHAYLLTNVPTELPVDELATFEELADPLEAVLPVSERALQLAECIRDVSHGSGPDGFRPEALVEHAGGDSAGEGDGAVRFDIRSMHRLASLNGIDVSERTVRRWVADLVDVGLLDPSEYKPQAGVEYTADSSTLTEALLVLTSNAGVEVAAKRRFRQIVEKARSSGEWLEWAREMLDLSGSRCDRDPPPDGQEHPV